MDLRIKDDLALVVGASDGIGLATAKALAPLQGAPAPFDWLA
jgi:NAD(P)-dependent dehydrogenase (short-subunit alcohol dehydrogenase family)